MHLRVDLPGTPALPKLGKALAFEASNHPRKGKLNAVIRQLFAYNRP
jgi:hypothetical protein